jgi:hypothetical protein
MKPLLNLAILNKVEDAINVQMKEVLWQESTP